MKTSKPKPICQSARTWLALRNGRSALGVFTGGTSRVFSAYLHLVEVWVHTQRKESVCALRWAVAMLQPSEWRLAAEAIAHAGDWGHIEELWDQIKPASAPSYGYHPASDRVVEVPNGSRHVGEAR